MLKSKKNEAIIISLHNTGLGVTRALGEKGVDIIALYHDANDMGYVSKYVKKKYHIPHPENSEKDFIAFLKELAKEHAGALLIPGGDASLVTVSKHKAELEQYYHVAGTEWDVTEKFIDKQYTYAVAHSLGIPAPRTLVPRSIEEVEQFGRQIEYPCMLKPSQSHLFYDIFKVKMFKTFNYDELLEIYKKIEPSGLDIMIQEYIPGDDTGNVNYNSYFWNNKPCVEFTAEKVRLSPKDSGVPCVVRSRDIPDVIENGRKLLAAMDFEGYSCTEFKKDVRTGVYKLLEVNGRHNRSSLLAFKCGINFPKMQFDHLVQGKLPEQSEYDKNVYWIDLLKDLFVSKNYLKEKGYSLKDFLLPYVARKRIFATLNVRDLRPFAKRVIDLGKKAFRIIIKKESLETRMDSNKKIQGKSYEYNSN